MDTNYTITYEDIIRSAPYWVCRTFRNVMPPEDAFHRVSMSFQVSSLAMDNPDFDWRRFVLAKIYNTLKRLRAQHAAKFLTLYESGVYTKVERETGVTIFKFLFCYTVIG